MASGTTVHESRQHLEARIAALEAERDQLRANARLNPHHPEAHEKCEPGACWTATLAATLQAQAQRNAPQEDVTCKCGAELNLVCLGCGRRRIVGAHIGENAPPGSEAAASVDPRHRALAEFVSSFDMALGGDEDGGVREWMAECGAGSLMEEWHAAIAAAGSLLADWRAASDKRSTSKLGDGR